MKEDFLHFIWQTKRFDLRELQSTQGQAIEIISYGQHNHDAGPDFLNGRVRIGDTIWAGNIEIHIQSSMWYAHQHQHDMAYENVILHVVLAEDKPVLRKNGSRIPCLELKNRIHKNLQDTYYSLLQSKHKIPCYTQFRNVPEHITHFFMERILVERLEQKTTHILADLERNNQDWNAVCYKYIGRCFGLSVNADAFEMLCHSLDWKILSKHKNQHLQIEALLFGQAGMLDREFVDEYPLKLQREYNFLR